MPAAHPAHGRREAKRVAAAALPASAGALLVLLLLPLALCVAADGPAEHRVYTNEEVGCSVSYPASWSLSTPYQNAVQIQHQSASRRETARVVVTWEKSVNADQAERRIEDLIESAARGRDFQLETIPTPDGELRFWTVLEPAAVPAPGDAGEGSRMLLRVGSALGDGWIIRAEGTTWEDADSALISDMKEICRSVRRIPGDGTQGGESQ